MALTSTYNKMWKSEYDVVREHTYILLNLMQCSDKVLRALLVNPSVSKPNVSTLNLQSQTQHLGKKMPLGRGEAPN